MIGRIGGFGPPRMGLSTVMPPPYGQRARREQITWPLITKLETLTSDESFGHLAVKLMPNPAWSDKQENSEPLDYFKLF